MSTQIVSFQLPPSSTGHIASLHSTLTTLKTDPAVDSVFYGTANDVSATVYIIINWNSQIPANANDMITPLTLHANGDPIIHLGTFPKPLLPLLSSPVTGLTLLSFPLHSVPTTEIASAAADFEATQDKVAGMITASPGSCSIVQGWADGDFEHEKIGRAKCHMMLAGWESEGAYLRFVKGAMRDLPAPDHRIEVLSHLVVFE